MILNDFGVALKKEKRYFTKPLLHATEQIRGVESSVRLPATYIYSSQKQTLRTPLN